MLYIYKIDPQKGKHHQLAGVKGKEEWTVMLFCYGRRV